MNRNYSHMWLIFVCVGGVYCGWAKFVTASNVLCPVATLTTLPIMLFTYMHISKRINYIKPLTTRLRFAQCSFGNVCAE